MKLEFSGQVFFFSETCTNIKFHENLSSGSRVVTDGRTDKTKLIVTFRNFAKAPKKNRHFLMDAMSIGEASSAAKLSVRFS